MAKSRRTRGQPKKSQSRLLLWLSLAVLVIGGVVVFLASQADASPKVAIDTAGAPKIKTDKDQVDLGDVTLGRQVEVSFQVENSGDQPLRITEAPYVEVVEGC